MSSTSILVVCPYFGSEHPSRLSLNCEAGRITFPDKRARLDFIFGTCGDLRGCQACPLHRMMDEAYERMTVPEVRKAMAAGSRAGRPPKSKTAENAPKTGVESTNETVNDSMQKARKRNTGKI